MLEDFVRSFFLTPEQIKSLGRHSADAASFAFVILKSNPEIPLDDLLSLVVRDVWETSERIKRNGS